MQIRDFIVKLQNLPEQKKKAIIIAVVIVLAFVFGFFWFRMSIQRLEKLGNVAKDIKLPEIKTPEIANLAPSQTQDWQTYKNEKYGFEIKYPNDWRQNNVLISDLEFILEKAIDKNSANIHLEIVSQTQKIEIAESGIDGEILKMRNIILPKTKIKIGEYDGYEVVGTLCTRICTGSEEDIYSPFSVIYFSDGKNVYRIDFVEGILGTGWKENIMEWEYYKDFKNIISTFKFINNK